MRRYILAAALALATVVAPVAHASHWERRADGSLYCAGSYPGIGAQGQLIVICPPDPITKEQADEYGRQWLQAHDAEAARQAEQSRQAKARGREIILQTCTHPDPSINTAWCADQLAHLND